MALDLGHKIPQFSLQNQEAEIVDSASLFGNPVVIFFYPKDFTPGCTKEVCSFRDAYQDFTDNGIQVIGISSDSIKTHKRFARKHRLPFTLLADGKGSVRKQFGVPSSMFGLLPGRTTFVFDKEGVLQMKFNSQLDALAHVEKVLRHFEIK
ncbi:peroxiredoxin [Urechidicola sp. KH5]